MNAWGDSLEVLVRERGSALFGYAYVLTGSADLADDLVQDALVRTFRAPRRFASIDHTHAYVKRAITTAFIDGARRAKVRPLRAVGAAGELDSVAHVQSGGHYPDHAQSVSDTADLHAAIVTLPPRERACIVLRFLEDKSVASIAAELGLAEGSVKRYLSDAVTTLRSRHHFDLDPDAPHHSSIPVTTQGESL